jgi:hypothetical protein
LFESLQSGGLVSNDVEYGIDFCNAKHFGNQIVYTADDQPPTHVFHRGMNAQQFSDSIRITLRKFIKIKQDAASSLVDDFGRNRFPKVVFSTRDQTAFELKDLHIAQGVILNSHHDFLRFKHDLRHLFAKGQIFLLGSRLNGQFQRLGSKMDHTLVSREFCKWRLLLGALLFTVLLMGFPGESKAQSDPVRVILEPIEIPQLPASQSYAFGQWEEKWLIIGGRIDGLHERFPFSTFDSAGRAHQLIVIDPIKKLFWTSSTNALPAATQEQLHSTNIQFVQTGKYLYLVGGYGYSPSTKDHITFENLLAIDVPKVIEAICEKKPMEAYFRQISDPQFAVTGGQMKRIRDTYYLVGGHRFDGRYNPKNHPTFTQTYTNQVRKFTLEDDGINLTVKHLPAVTDSFLLHRRDYNVVQQILKSGKVGLAAFSGVFQPHVDLPYQNCVLIDENDVAEAPGFWQYFNHYECPTLPIWDREMSEMHTLFFGGIAQYYDSLGWTVQDNNVPFVKTIARVTRHANGTWEEYRLPKTMPDFLGAGAHFIPSDNAEWTQDEILLLNELDAERPTHVGYIYGGIKSSQANIFWINDGPQSAATSAIYKVSLLKFPRDSKDQLNEWSTDPVRMNVFPDLIAGVFHVRFNLLHAGPAKLKIQNLKGKTMIEVEKEDLQVGANEFQFPMKKFKKVVSCIVTLEVEGKKRTQHILIAR